MMWYRPQIQKPKDGQWINATFVKDGERIYVCGKYVAETGWIRELSGGGLGDWCLSLCEFWSDIRPPEIEIIKCAN